MPALTFKMLSQSPFVLACLTALFGWLHLHVALPATLLIIGALTTDKTLIAKLTPDTPLQKLIYCALIAGAVWLLAAALAGLLTLFQDNAVAHAPFVTLWLSCAFWLLLAGCLLCGLVAWAISGV